MVFDLDIGDIFVGLGVKCDEEVLDRIMSLRNRLFYKISFSELFVVMDGSASALAFIQQFIHNFETQQLSFFIIREPELDNALKLIDYFPRSMYSLEIWCIVPPEKLLVFPPMEKLSLNISSSDTVVPNQVPVELLYKMISMHKYLSFDGGYVRVTLDEWKRAMEIISDHRNLRIVKFTMESATIVSYLRSYGISESSEDGERVGEFEVLGNYPEDMICHSYASIHLRFKNCWISIRSLEWTSDFSGTNVTMTNRE